ncbi:MAG: hypothetical protein KKA79_01000 [Nanoarchaeota archaeon]|nr:hypothetical protein [Nanoarchaeota archaeon]MCG2718159.1 hypothetical protein [Nanoarchaeota archaeon]
MSNIRRDELEKAMDAFMKEIKVMLKAFDKDDEADVIEELYDQKKEVMLEDTVKYLKEVEHMEFV